MNIRKYELKLRTEQPIRIGGVDDPLGGIDNQVAMVGNRLCVPGTSLKGAYRNELERWLNATYRDADGNWKHDSLQPCLTSTEPSTSENALITEKNFKEACKYSDDGGVVCPVCYLLGAPGLVGFVSIPFLFATPQERPGTLYATRIDRVSNTVTSGNRSYQFVAPETVFTGTVEVILEDPFLHWTFGKKRQLISKTADAWIEHAELGDDIEACLKTLVCDRLQAIRRIGGFKSKGFGSVTLSLTKPNP